MVFGINSASNAVRKCEIVRGEAECYFTLPDCIASAINPNTTVWAILLQINPTSTMSLIGTVLVEHSMLLLLKNLTLFVAAISIGVAMVAGSGSSTGLKSELRAFRAARLLYFRSRNKRLKVRKLSRYCCFSHTTVFTLN